MAFEAKDGKKFSMSSRRRAHDMGHGAATEEPEQKMDPLSSPEGEDGQEEQDGEQVAAEHGPATEVHATHDHEMGVHHVHSVHPDGYEHHSDHSSAEEAADHHRKVTGHKDMAHEEDESGGSYGSEGE